MGYAVTIEKWAENLEEVTLHRWLKAEGEPLAVGESLCEIITEKITFEWESPVSGVVCRRYCQEGAAVPVGYVIAWIGEAGERPPERIMEENAGLAVEYLDRLKLEFNEEPEADAPLPEPPAGVAASPAARRLARERQVSLEAVRAWRGGEARLSESDVRDYLDSPGADPHA
ncbi:MAG TPA: biotin/lipoyl-containing protein [Armatimonadota bacterium]|jgi:pyruvate/2-oxoglutarate dehydrogenase complex dihydrolipoamide acyltransferase (E2) component